MPESKLNRAATARNALHGFRSTRHQEHPPSVLLMDGNYAYLRDLKRTLEAHGFRVTAHHSTRRMFRVGPPPPLSCIILGHPSAEGKTAAQVHVDLKTRGWNHPVVYLVEHWTVKSVVAAMRAGAHDFLTIPCNPSDLVDSIRQAHSRALASAENHLEYSDLRLKASSLTPRELEIVRCVAAGLRNKDIAESLGIAVVTVKVHRSRAIRKLGAGNPAEMARLAAIAGLIE